MSEVTWVFLAIAGVVLALLIMAALFLPEPQDGPKERRDVRGARPGIRPV